MFISKFQRWKSPSLLGTKTGKTQVLSTTQGGVGGAGGVWVCEKTYLVQVSL